MLEELRDSSTFRNHNRVAARPSLVWEAYFEQSFRKADITHLGCSPSSTTRFRGSAKRPCAGPTVVGVCQMMGRILQMYPGFRQSDGAGGSGGGGVWEFCLAPTLVAQGDERGPKQYDNHWGFGGFVPFFSVCGGSLPEIWGKNTPCFCFTHFLVFFCHDVVSTPTSRKNHDGQARRREALLPFSIGSAGNRNSHGRVGLRDRIPRLSSPVRFAPVEEQSQQRTSTKHSFCEEEDINVVQPLWLPLGQRHGQSVFPPSLKRKTVGSFAFRNSACFSLNYTLHCGYLCLFVILKHI